MVDNADLKRAQEEANDMVSLKVEGTDGVTDVIGIEVLSIHGNITTEDEADTFINNNTETRLGIVEVDGQTYVVKTTTAQLNKVNMVDPMDLDSKTAIPIQVKITELLQASGMDVGINEEMQAEIEEEMAKAKAELDVDKCVDDTCVDKGGCQA